MSRIKHWPAGETWIAALHIVVLLLVTGCGVTTSATPVPEPATYDLAAVIATFEDECPYPVVVDRRFCDSVLVDEMTADGNILNVVTTLHPDSHERAEAICDQMAAAHFDADGNDLGYEVISILDRNDSNLATCSVR